MNMSPRSRTKAMMAFVLLFTVSVLGVGSLAYDQVSNTLTVDYIDVGQGDSIYLHASDGTDILIDGGPRSAGPTIVAHLQNAGIDDIEVLVLTHGDPNRVGGLIDVLRYLEAIGAEVAVISVGANNIYGHPAQETIDRLKAAGARVLRTDRHDTMTVITDGETYNVYANFVVFLPFMLRQEPPTPTPTPTNTPTPTPTSTPTATPTQGPVTSGDINIVTIFYRGMKGRQEPDEYVEIRNDDSRAIQLSGWTLRDEANHVYMFPSFVMQPGQTCRVYTNENHPESCGFSYGSGSAIWNNSAGCAFLRDSTNALVDILCYLD